MDHLTPVKAVHGSELSANRMSLTRNKYQKSASGSAAVKYAPCVLDSSHEVDEPPKLRPKRFNMREFEEIIDRGQKRKCTHHEDAMTMFKEVSQKGLDAAKQHMDGKAKFQSMQRVNTRRIELTNLGLVFNMLCKQPDRKKMPF